MVVFDVASRGIVAPLELVYPLYRVRKYSDSVYKVVRFNSPGPRVGVVRPRMERDPNKLSDLRTSVSRAKRVVLELALCNQWDYFCTFTLSPAYDRTDLPKWYKAFAQWIRNQRKKSGADIRYVLVPERHKNGCWHIHGLMSGVPDLISFSDRMARGDRVPVDLAHNGYFCWMAYEKKFGWNSFGLIRNSVATALYIVKYVAKQLDEESSFWGAHRYYATLGLNRSAVHAEIYESCSYLEKFIQNEYQFCGTGFAMLGTPTWHFAMEFLHDELSLEPLVSLDPGHESVISDDEFEYMQVSLQDWLRGYL